MGAGLAIPAVADPGQTRPTGLGNVVNERDEVWCGQ
jgi:hypothetical protein